MKFTKVLFISLFSCLTVLAIKVPSAAAATTINVDNGQTLFDVLTGKQAVNDNTVTINVTNDITLPADDHPKLSSNFKNVTVNFQKHGFKVMNPVGSVISVPASLAAHVTVKNLVLDGKEADSSNIARNIPRPNGQGTTTGYYVTYYGMLFSSDWLGVQSTTTSNALITYTDITYNFPNSQYWSQPLATYAIPVEFTGNNNITTNSSGQEVAEISNLSVTAGTTTFTALDNSYQGKVFRAFYNSQNNQTFLINISPNANLTINSDSSVPLFKADGVNNSYQFTNNGTLNLNLTNPKGALFGNVTTPRVQLNSGTNASTNIVTTGSLFNSALKATAITTSLAESSRTSLIAKQGFVFDSSTPWNNGTNIQVDDKAKLLAYSGGATTGGGLTNTLAAYVPFSFTAPNRVKNFSSPLPTIWPSDSNSFDEYSQQLTNLASRSVSGQMNSSTFLNNSNNALLITNGSLEALSLGANQLAWQYDLKTFNKFNILLPPTKPNQLIFNIKDDRTDQPHFAISATYLPARLVEPFTMWFKKGNAQPIGPLNTSPMTVLTPNDMQNNQGTYSFTGNQRQGMFIKVKPNVQPSQYSGKLNWTLVDAPD